MKQRDNTTKQLKTSQKMQRLKICFIKK